jgi:hypothetical protein
MHVDWLVRPLSRETLLWQGSEASYSAQLLRIPVPGCSPGMHNPCSLSSLRYHTIGQASRDSINFKSFVAIRESLSETDEPNTLRNPYIFPSFDDRQTQVRITQASKENGDTSVQPRIKVQLLSDLSKLSKVSF